MWFLNNSSLVSSELVRTFDALTVILFCMSPFVLSWSWRTRGTGGLCSGGTGELAGVKPCPISGGLGYKGREPDNAVYLG